MDELVEVLEYLDMCGGLGADKHNMIQQALAKYRAFKAEAADDGLRDLLKTEEQINEFYPSPVAPQGPTEVLVEALEKLARLGNGDRYGNSDGNIIAQEALSRYKAEKEEPLAVLADRKGVYIRAIRHYPDAGQWCIYIQELSIWLTSANYGVEHTGKTYPAAEAATRAYLNSLPDIKETKL